MKLLLLPQRYVFSSKSQPIGLRSIFHSCCCCYHKGTYFQANHNRKCNKLILYHVVVATTKVRIFKQITTANGVRFPTLQLLLLPQRYVFSSKSQLTVVSRSIVVCCCCYHKGTYFQANHNGRRIICCRPLVVVATTKVRIFKQITTLANVDALSAALLLLPQRYVFSSKSQHGQVTTCTYIVVVATTKVRIFKQITTVNQFSRNWLRLLLLPQRYVFSSKSQRMTAIYPDSYCCCCYHKGTYFQANHNI